MTLVKRMTVIWLTDEADRPRRYRSALRRYRPGRRTPRAGPARVKRLAHDEREVIVAYPTLLEAYTLVLYRLGIQSASAWLNDILNGAALINPTPEDYHEAVTKLLALPDQAITLFDATAAVLASRLGGWRFGLTIITLMSCVPPYGASVTPRDQARGASR